MGATIKINTNQVANLRTLSASPRRSSSAPSPRAKMSACQPESSLGQSVRVNQSGRVMLSCCVLHEHAAAALCCCCCILHDAPRNVLVWMLPLAACCCCCIDHEYAVFLSLLDACFLSRGQIACLYQSGRHNILILAYVSLDFKPQIFLCSIRGRMRGGAPS